jgi:hypothetical protein
MRLLEHFGNEFYRNPAPFHDRPQFFIQPFCLLIIFGIVFCEILSYFRVNGDQIMDKERCDLSRISSLGLSFHKTSIFDLLVVSLANFSAGFLNLTLPCT